MLTRLSFEHFLQYLLFHWVKSWWTYILKIEPTQSSGTYIDENCSSPIKLQSLPTERTKVPRIS